jgi:hypothetical protein
MATGTHVNRMSRALSYTEFMMLMAMHDVISPVVVFLCDSLGIRKAITVNTRGIYFFFLFIDQIVYSRDQSSFMWDLAQLGSKFVSYCIASSHSDESCSAGALLDRRFHIKLGALLHFRG